MRGYGARSLTVSVAQSTAGSILLGGPIRLKGWSLSDGIADQGLNANGTQTAPPAGTNVATISLPNGEFTIEWNVELSGTPGVADIDNVRLVIGATQIAKSTNLGVVGDYPQANAVAVVLGGPLTLSAKAVGNATAGAVYVINLTIIPTGRSQGQVLDGGQIVGLPSMAEGATDNVWLGEDGVAIRTSVSVLTVQGALSGVLWYETVYWEDYPPESSQHGQ